MIKYKQIDGWHTTDGGISVTCNVRLIGMRRILAAIAIMRAAAAVCRVLGLRVVIEADVQ